MADERHETPSPQEKHPVLLALERQIELEDLRRQDDEKSLAVSEATDIVNATEQELSSAKTALQADKNEETERRCQEAEDAFKKAKDQWKVAFHDLLPVRRLYLAAWDRLHGEES